MSQVVITGQVLRVEQRPTRNGGTKYTVSYSDGNDWVTFDLGTAERAFGMIGQPSTLTGEIKNVNRQGRTFTNRDLVSLVAGVQPGVAQTATGVPQSGFQPQGGGIPQVGAGGAAEAVPASRTIPNVGDGEAERIARGNAVNALGALYAGSGVPVEQFLADAAVVAKFIREGVLPDGNPQPGQFAPDVDTDDGIEY